MKKRDNLSKKLLAYSGMAAAFMCGKNADAQIIYHDVVPDEVLGYAGNAYFLDLNNDGTSDIGFAKSSTSSSTSSGENNFSIYVYGSDVYNRISEGPLNLNDPIDSNLSWQGFLELNQYFYNSGNTVHNGAWINITNKFLPLRHIENGHNYFGWVRLSAGFATLTIHDWGMSIIPDQPVIAGDTSNIATAVHNNVLSNNEAPKIRLLYSSLLISFPQNPKTSSNFTIIDLLGRKRYETNSYQSSTQISIVDLEAGEYLLMVKNEKTSTVFRFFKN